MNWRLVLLTAIAACFAAAQARAQTRTVTCSSDDGAYHTCSVDTRGGVRLVRQLSESPCREGQTWGLDANRIWVDRGCRAEFQSGSYADRQGGANVVRCSSDDEKRHFCPADTRGGVRLARQISDTRCREGVNWGYDNGGVWVDQGCRAEFEILSYTARFTGGGNVIRCSSDDERRHVCAADTSGGVRLLRRVSESPCDQGYGWGYDRNGIWVDHGCRAEFETQSGGTAGGFQRQTQANVVRCSSDDGGRQVCSADTARGVRLVRQLSSSPCRQGQTWGYDRNGIWVDRGCRADFETESTSRPPYFRR